MVLAVREVGPSPHIKCFTQAWKSAVSNHVLGRVAAACFPRSSIATVVPANKQRMLNLPVHKVVIDVVTRLILALCKIQLINNPFSFITWRTATGCCCVAVVFGWIAIAIVKQFKATFTHAFTHMVMVNYFSFYYERESKILKVKKICLKMTPWPNIAVLKSHFFPHK